MQEIGAIRILTLLVSMLLYMSRTCSRLILSVGLNEYLLWCQDMGMTPVLAVWSGLSLGGGIISGSALDPYVDDILNELEVSRQSTEHDLE
jgi:hypothetical protein